MKQGKLRVIEGGLVAFYCPGCKQYHAIPVNGSGHPMWTFNNNYEKPTFSPSVLVTGGHYMPNHTGRCWCDYNKEHPDDPVLDGCFRCHSFVTDGKIQYLSDCTHALAGQTVDLIDPDELEGNDES